MARVKTDGEVVLELTRVEAQVLRELLRYARAMQDLAEVLNRQEYMSPIDIHNAVEDMFRALEYSGHL